MPTSKIDDLTLFTMVMALAASWLVAVVGLALTIERKYLRTFVSLQTGYADTQAYFLYNEGDDARRILIFFHTERQWRAIRARVRLWVLGIYASWLALMPAWFTTDLRARIPDEFMPAQVVHDLDAQAPGGRRLTLKDMGLARRISPAVAVSADDSSNSDEGVRVPAPKHLRPASSQSAEGSHEGTANEGRGVHLEWAGGGSASLTLGNLRLREIALSSSAPLQDAGRYANLKGRYRLTSAPRIYTIKDEREAAASAGVSALAMSPSPNTMRQTCALQVIGLSDGERTIARIEAEKGRVVECGADGDCVFHAFIVAAILNAALEIAVSQSARQPVDLLGRIG
jgi:hypothetical protein